jgi:hypothetical protein
MKNLVICGDSFSIGIGCHNLHDEPYGSLLSKKLGLNLINLAKGSSTNLSIFLQVKYAIENIKDIDYVIIGVTSNNRTEWFPENEETNKHWELDNRDVNYHQYPPYGKSTYPYIIDSHMVNNERYSGKMFTENYYGIIDYVENWLDKGVGSSDYFSKFHNERPERMRLLRQYYYEIFDESIQRQYDTGVITLAHTLLKNNGIKHYILTCDSIFDSYIPSENLINIDWGHLSLKYPDDLPSLHTSYEGHIEVYNTIISKLTKKLI